MASLRLKNESAKPGRGRPRRQSPVKLDANEDMLHYIEVMMDDLWAEIITKVGSIMSESLKKDVAIALGPLEENTAAQSCTVLDLERSAKEHYDQLVCMF